MSTKITLISPPDIYQNGNYSLLLIDIDEKEQESISSWLGRSITKESLNVYYYQGEPNVPWLLHALSCADSKYINLNNTSAVSSYLAGYILSKPSVYYTTKDTNLALLYNHINLNRVNNCEEFLERVFSGKN